MNRVSEGNRKNSRFFFSLSPFYIYFLFAESTQCAALKTHECVCLKLVNFLTFQASRVQFVELFLYMKSPHTLASIANCCSQFVLIFNIEFIPQCCRERENVQVELRTWLIVHRQRRESFFFSPLIYMELVGVLRRSLFSPIRKFLHDSPRVIGARESAEKRTRAGFFFFRCENICFRELHEEPLRSLPPISFQDFFSESRKKIASRLTVKIAIGLLENCKFGWLHTHRFARSLSGRTQDVSVRFKTCCTNNIDERFRLMADERRRESIDLARHLSANNASSLDRKKKKKQQSNRLLRRHFSFTAREMC